MMETLIERSRKYLDYFYLNIEPASWNQALDICLKTKGHIYFTGIGKSGFIAQKIAMTLVSLGTRSLFLDPAVPYQAVVLYNFTQEEYFILIKYFEELINKVSTKRKESKINLIL